MKKRNKIKHQFSIKEISTKPNKASFRWIDSVSILSCILLYIIYFERYFSILQWCKEIYRSIPDGSSRKRSKDVNSIRKNVPSQLVEIYYVVAVTVMIPVLFLNKIPLIYVILAWYFIIDSTVWMLYYFFFRRFFEEKYAIMHRLEYIVVFPLVLILQAISICAILSVNFSTSIKYLINPDMETPVPILILSIFYTAVVLGLVISNLPQENIKISGDCKYYISIIGNGDVVRERLLKAITKYVTNNKQYFPIAVYDIDKKECNIDTIPPHAKFLSINDETQNKGISSSKILWIATPSYAHYCYVEKYLGKVKLIVCEKPITVFPKELMQIKHLCETGFRDNLFFLSYYYLEKALPFTFLMNPLFFYCKYLEFEKMDSERQNIPTEREDIIKLFSSFGKIKEVEIQLNEGPESREWTMDEKNGGQLMETFIHPAVVCLSAIGEDKIKDGGELKIEKGQTNKEVSIIYKGQTESGTMLNLLMTKGMNGDSSRYAKLTYSEGIVKMDFSTQKAELIDKDGNTIANIKTKQSINDGLALEKYGIQFDMVMRCYNQEVLPSIVDGRHLQIKAIEWLNTFRM